jgi:DNA-binding FadR family transcriptional regulator
VLKALITLLASDDLGLHKEFEKHVEKRRILERRMNALEEHGKILEAIKAKDPVKAVEAMKEHYRRSKTFREKVRANL